MNGNSFRDLIVWQKARVLATRVYKITRALPREEMFGMSAQMRRAALSIVSNIAEGKGRQTNAEYRSFLIFGRGSAYELDAQLIIAADLEYLAAETADELSEKTAEVARILTTMIQKLTK